MALAVVKEKAVPDELSAERLLTIVDVAELLRVTRRQVYQLVRTGELRCIRIGRYVRVSTKDVREFIETRRS